VRERLVRGTVLDGRVADLQSSTLAGRPAAFALALVGAQVERSLVTVPLEGVEGDASLGRSWRSDLVTSFLGAAAGAGGSALAAPPLPRRRCRWQRPRSGHERPTEAR
jgi:hypothetical protein